MRKLFKERKLIKGGNYMRKYGICIEYSVVCRMQIQIPNYTYMRKCIVQTVYENIQ